MAYPSKRPRRRTRYVVAVAAALAFWPTVTVLVTIFRLTAVQEARPDAPVAKWGRPSSIELSPIILTGNRASRFYTVSESLSCDDPRLMSDLAQILADAVPYRSINKVKHWAETKGVKLTATGEDGVTRHLRIGISPDHAMACFEEFDASDDPVANSISPLQERMFSRDLVLYIDGLIQGAGRTWVRANYQFWQTGSTPRFTGSR